MAHDVRSLELVVEPICADQRRQRFPTLGVSLAGHCRANHAVEFRARPRRGRRKKEVVLPSEGIAEKGRVPERLDRSDRPRPAVAGHVERRIALHVLLQSAPINQPGHPSFDHEAG